jgi:hypothetical protein
MKKKKIIVISIFLALIVMTSFVFLKGAIDSYRYDMDPANGIDIMEGMGAVMLLGLGGFVVFYELDLFYTVYYFFIRPKTITKSVLNIFSNLTLLTVFFTDSISHFLYKYVSEIFSVEMIVLSACLLIYAVLRTVCAMISVRQTEKDNSFC